MLWSIGIAILTNFFIHQTHGFIFPAKLFSAGAAVILALSPAPNLIVPAPTTTVEHILLSQSLHNIPTSSLLLSKDELPSLEKCFNAVRKELSPTGESLLRLKEDIDKGDYKDIIAFTREYDAGFRGGVLKSAWKQLGDSKGRGIQVSNSFTFDLIALNKAARVEDKTEALRCLDLIKQDLVDFLALEPKSS